MFIYNSRIKNLKTNIFFMIIVSNFYSLSMRCEKQESQSQKSQSKISQYKVLQQEDGSSCGYHALYNAITIAKSLKNPSFKAFLDTDIGRSNYFGSSNSKWERHIIEKRVNLLAQNYIRDCLLKKLKNIEILTKKPDSDCYELNLSSLWVKLNINDLNALATIKAFGNMITNVSKIVVESSIVEQEDKRICRISSEYLREIFRQECIRRNIKIDNFDELFLEIFNFTEPFDLEFEIVSDSKIVDLNNGGIYTVNWMTSSDKRFNKVDSENQIFTTINPGHWLSSQELESLVDLEKEDTELIGLEIFCLDRDIEQLFNQNTGEELLINTQRNFQDINYSGTAVFLIYDSRHWITCVITKDAGEYANFIFADSLGNNYKSYVRARTLIRLLTNTDIEDKNDLCLNESETETKSIESESDSAFDIIENLVSVYCDSMARLYIPLVFLFDEYTDEKVHLMKTDLFIEDLKEGRNFDKSILISGPPKTGKFSLAYSIAVEAQLLFVPIAATSLVDATLFNKKDENNREDTDYGSINIQPIDIFFYITQKYKSPMVIFIHLLDKLLLKADSKESKKLLINYLLNKLIEYKKKNKVLFIISSYIPFEKYPENINFIGLCPDTIKLELPDYNKRLKIMIYYFNDDKNRLFEDEEKNIQAKKVSEFLKIIRSEDIRNLASMMRGLSCADIKEFIRLACFAKIKGKKYENSISSFQFWWNSQDFKGRTFETILTKYNPLAFPINKVSGLFENYDKEFTNTLYSCWLIKSNEIKERNKLDENFSYQSNASYITQCCKESENVQLVKQCFIYVSETKIGQAVSEGIAEEVKDVSKLITKKVFEKTATVTLQVGTGVYKICCMFVPKFKK